MALLTVSRPGADGPQKVRVTRSAPVSIGNHSSVDVQIDSMEVPPLLARISWNGDAFEAEAAGSDNIIINGLSTRLATMNDGDTLEVDEVVITMHRGGKSKVAATTAAASDAASDAASEVATEDDPVTLDEFTPLDADNDLFDDDFATPESTAPVANAVDDTGLATEEDTGTGRAVPTADRLAEQTGTIVTPDGETLSPDELEARRDEAAKQRELRQKLRARGGRPGERDPIRSPLLQGLAGLIVVLLFGSVVLGLVLRQQSVQAEFDTAVAARESGNYAEAIKKFQAFIDAHPSGELTTQARGLLALSEVDRLVRAAAPEWDEALAGLQKFIDRSRDDEDFGSLYPEIAERAGTIALGAAADAGARRNPDLLGISQAAEQTLVTYSPEAVPPEKLQDQIEQTRRKSRQQLQTLDVLDASLADMKAAGRPLDVLRIYRGMVAAEPTLARNAEARDLRDAARQQLEDSVATQPVDEIAAELDAAELDAAEAPRDFSALAAVATPAVLQRPPGREQQSGGLIAGVHVGGSLFGVDTGSGDPLWRVPLGSRFRPVEVSDPQPGWVGDDPARDGLVYVGRDGQTIASVALPAAPLRPRPDGASVLVPLADDRLVRANLSQGVLTAAVRLPQSIRPEPAVVGDRVVAFGERDMVYVLDAASLQRVGLYEMGHAAGSIIAAPLAAARLIVVPVNDPRGGRLVLLELNDGDELVQAGQADVPGRVDDPPQLRGRDLFVPSTGGRATVLTINDEGGGSIVKGPTYVSGSRSNVSTYLRPGSDRQFWMVGERMRRLRTTADSIRPVGRTLQLGIPTEPPVRIGDELLVASKPRAELATRVSLYRGDDLGRAWLLYLGDAIQAVSDSDNPVAITRDGFSVRLRDGLVSEASDRLDGPVTHAIALPDGTLAAVGAADREAVEPAAEEETPAPSEAAAVDVGSTYRVAFQPGGAAGTLTFVSRSGRVSRRQPLTGIPTVAPLLWRDGLLVAPPGRLAWVPLDRGGSSPPDFWLAQGGAAPPDWRAVAALDAERLVTLDADGTLRLLTWQADPPQIIETATAAQPGLSLLAAAGETIVASDSQRLLAVDPSTLERTGQPTGLARIDRLVAAGDAVVAGGVDADAKPLVVVVRGDQTQPLAGAGPLLGAASIGDALAITTAGRLWTVRGATVESVPLPIPASGAPLPLQGAVAVPLEDGTLMRTQR